MKKVLDSQGKEIFGLFKKADGSFFVKDEAGLKKSKLSKANFDSLNNEVKELKEQMKKIMEMLNAPNM